MSKRRPQSALWSPLSLLCRSDRGQPHPIYAAQYVELAFTTTVHGAQGDTVDRAHVAMGDTTGAAAYVAMTRGRTSNTAHLVAESVDDARQQWIDVFGRDRADLGPAHARRQAIEAIDRYGPRLKWGPVGAAGRRRG